MTKGNARARPAAATARRSGGFCAKNSAAGRRTRLREEELGCGKKNSAAGRRTRLREEEFGCGKKNSAQRRRTRLGEEGFGCGKKNSARRKRTRLGVRSCRGWRADNGEAHRGSLRQRRRTEMGQRRRTADGDELECGRRRWRRGFASRTWGTASRRSCEQADAVREIGESSPAENRVEECLTAAGFGVKKNYGVGGSVPRREFAGRLRQDPVNTMTVVRRSEAEHRRRIWTATPQTDGGAVTP